MIFIHTKTKHYEKDEIMQVTPKIPSLSHTPCQSGSYGEGMCESVRVNGTLDASLRLKGRILMPERTHPYAMTLARCCLQVRELMPASSRGVAVFHAWNSPAHYSAWGSTMLPSSTRNSALLSPSHHFPHRNPLGINRYERVREFSGKITFLCVGLSTENHPCAHFCTLATGTISILQCKAGIVCCYY